MLCNALLCSRFVKYLLYTDQHFIMPSLIKIIPCGLRNIKTMGLIIIRLGQCPLCTHFIGKECLGGQNKFCLCKTVVISCFSKIIVNSWPKPHVAFK